MYNLSFSRARASIDQPGTSQMLDVVSSGSGFLDADGLLDGGNLGPGGLLIPGGEGSSQEGGSSANEGEWSYDPSEPRYCICNQVSYGEMVACDNDDVSINLKKIFSELSLYV